MMKSGNNLNGAVHRDRLHFPVILISHLIAWQLGEWPQPSRSVLYGFFHRLPALIVVLIPS